MDSDYVIVSSDDCHEVLRKNDFGCGCSRPDSSGHRPAYLSEIESLIDNNARPLWALNAFIHDTPELAYREHRAHHALTDFIRRRDEPWHVTPSAFGMPTAWIAVYDSQKPGPVVSFNVEYDALPTLGHACGHNLIATASLSAALATAHILTLHPHLGGKVLLFGTPGEEGFRGGKLRFLQQSAYRQHGVDISLISHPSIANNSARVRTSAFAKVKVEYFGKAARVGRNEWEGVNALDALVTGYTAVAALRGGLQPGETIGVGIVNGGGEAANVVHEYASMVCMVHARTARRLEVVRERVEGCLRAGGLATGARVVVEVTRGYKDHVPNGVLARSYERCWRELKGPAPDPQIPSGCCGTEPGVMYVASSTDQGDVSYAMPSLNASFAIPPGPEGKGPHTADFEKAAGTKEAFERALRVGKALAGVAVDVLTTEGLLEEVKREWRRDMDEINKGGVDV
ncbi:hypothetical protein QBC34DRAFT_477610 [Podospora aff. communis PSN243]|uniref:Peptidase M20 domain-containing protein 2 n=1 Tax=Podospora aff. communis PSN243 TaxID=3040156 RepID=A0AAV9G4X3_9PEZI|nr:hypothetical protein QBC34DRAFT_477610 [Podospora aff. communis PSN243]